MYNLLTVEGKPISPWLNDMLEAIDQSNVAFLSTLIFACIGYYFMAAGIKGNVKFGLRFFCVTFYPMVQGETFINAFLFNALLMNIWAVALTQFLAVLFRTYARFTDVMLIFEVQVKYMRFFHFFWVYDIFVYCFIVWMFVSLAYFILRPVEKIPDLKARDLK